MAYDAHRSRSRRGVKGSQRVRDCWCRHAGVAAKPRGAGDRGAVLHRELSAHGDVSFVFCNPPLLPIPPVYGVAGCWQRSTYPGSPINSTYWPMTGSFFISLWRNLLRPKPPTTRTTCAPKRGVSIRKAVMNEVAERTAGFLPVVLSTASICLRASSMMPLVIFRNSVTISLLEYSCHGQQNATMVFKGRCVN